MVDVHVGVALEPLADEVDELLERAPLLLAVVRPEARGTARRRPRARGRRRGTRARRSAPRTGRPPCRRRGRPARASGSSARPRSSSRREHARSACSPVRRWRSWSAAWWRSFSKVAGGDARDDGLGRRVRRAPASVVIPASPSRSIWSRRMLATRVRWSCSSHQALAEREEVADRSSASTGQGYGRPRVVRRRRGSARGRAGSRRGSRPTR